jgi:hypothetical protein
MRPAILLAFGMLTNSAPAGEVSKTEIEPGWGITVRPHS